MFMLWTSMARVAPTGVVSGPDERVDAYTGPQALTTGPAWQIFEEDRKGRIKPGLLADFVILDKNPPTTPVDAIKDIETLETIKEGKSVWRVPGQGPRRHRSTPASHRRITQSPSQPVHIPTPTLYCP